MQDYTNSLYKKLSNNLDLFTHAHNFQYDKFNACNFSIWHKIINDESQDNFQINIPCETSISSFYESTLRAIVTSKYAQNINSNREAKRFEIEDRLYCPKKHKIYHYRGFEGAKVRLVDKNSTSYRSVSDLNKMFILNSKHTLTCHTTTYFKRYYDDFLSIFPNSEILTKFTKKTVIVVSKEFLDTNPQKKILPIRYNLEIDSACPVEPLIEVINDFATIENLLWTDNHGIEEVIFLGFNKYKNLFLDAIEHQNCGRIKKVILLGEQLISQDYQFRSWYWTTKELFYLKNNYEKNLTFHAIDSSKVLAFVTKFNVFAEKLINAGTNSEHTKGVILRYLTYFLIPPLINSANSTLNILMEELNSGNSDFEIILDNAGINAIPYITELNTFLTELNELLTAINPKLEAIKFLSSNNNIKATYIIVKSRRSANELGKFTDGIKGLKVLTHQELRTYLKKPKENGLFNQEGNLRRNHFVFTHLYLDHNPTKRNPLAIYNLYEETLQYGLATVLYYDVIERDRVNKIIFFAQQQRLRNLTHSDRSFFVGDLVYDLPSTIPENIDLTTVEETQKVLSVIESGFSMTDESSLEDYTIKLNDYFAKYFGEYRKMGKNKFDNIEFDEDELDEWDIAYVNKVTLKSQTKFEITFDDNSSDILYGTQKIACKAENGDHVIGIKVEDLKITNKIIDFDLKFDKASDILETIPKAKEDIAKIQKASKLWREWLNYSLENYKQIHKLSYDDACKKLTKSLAVSVSEATVRTWLKNKEKYYFPRTNDDLEKVLDLRIRQTLESQKEDIKQKAIQIRESRNMSASFKEVITQLKIELGNYMINKHKGNILNHIKSDNDIKKLLSNQQFKNIIKIEKL